MCRLEERVLWWIYYDGTKVELILTVGVTLLSNVVLEFANLEFFLTTETSNSLYEDFKNQDVLGS